MLIDGNELLRRIDQLSPTCSEPQVFMDRPYCNCMVGIHYVKTMLLQMIEEK